MSLTPKQEQFCQLYLETGNASDAYRQVYGSKAKPGVVHVKASELLSHGKVSVRVQELRQQLAKAALWSREQSVRVLADIAIGDEEAKPGDRIGAVRELNRMHGWDGGSDRPPQAPVTVTVTRAK
jgi:phage terminase small subunit